MISQEEFTAKLNALHDKQRAIGIEISFLICDHFKTSAAELKLEAESINEEITGPSFSDLYGKGSGLWSSDEDFEKFLAGTKGINREIEGKNVNNTGTFRTSGSAGDKAFD